MWWDVLGLQDHGLAEVHWGRLAAFAGALIATWGSCEGEQGCLCPLLACLLDPSAYLLRGGETSRCWAPWLLIPTPPPPTPHSWQSKEGKEREGSLSAPSPGQC